MALELGNGGEGDRAGGDDGGGDDGSERERITAR